MAWFRLWIESVKDLGVEFVGPRSVGSTDHASFDSAGIPGFQSMQGQRATIGIGVLGDRPNNAIFASTDDVWLTDTKFIVWRCRTAHATRPVTFASGTAVVQVRIGAS